MSIISSSLVEALGQKNLLDYAVRTYTASSFKAIAGLSEGRPPRDHDARIEGYRTALSQYGESLRHDADAIKQIGIAFEGKDRETAWGLLGF